MTRRSNIKPKKCPSPLPGGIFGRPTEEILSMKEIEEGSSAIVRNEELFCGGEAWWVCVEGGVLGRMTPRAYHPPNSVMLSFKREAV